MWNPAQTVVAVLMTMAAQQAHNHGPPPGYPELRLAYTGVSEHTENFVAWLRNQPIVINVNYNCARCCCHFLVGERRYQLINHQMECVMFEGQPETSCYVDGPQGHRGRYGVVKTGHDNNLGQTSIRPVNRSHSYQFYGAFPDALAIGQDLTARLEAIAVTQLNGRHKLQSCYLNYADAALLEVYRSALRRPSLEGNFSRRPLKVEDKEDAADAMPQRLAKLNVH